MEEQESFLSSEQQQKMETYEHDADFAHIIASQLNQLIDEHVLTVEDVERASHEVLDEFLYRFYDSIADAYFSESNKDKIKRFFRGEPTDVVNIKEVGPVGEQYVAVMKEVLRQVHRNPNTVSGMILFGSRMGDYADSESDCDFSFVFKRGPRVFLLHSLLPKISDEICKKYDFPKLHEKLELRFPITIEELNRMLKNSRYLFTSKQFWAWDPRRVRYIGTGEKRINQQIQQVLNSDEFKQYKEETLHKIKELVKQRAQVSGS